MKLNYQKLNLKSKMQWQKIKISNKITFKLSNNFKSPSPWWENIPQTFEMNIARKLQISKPSMKAAMKKLCNYNLRKIKKSLLTQFWKIKSWWKVLWHQVRIVKIWRIWLQTFKNYYKRRVKLFSNVNLLLCSE